MRWKTGLNELMQIYTIKIVAGARGRVPAIVGYDLTRLRRAKVLFIANVGRRLYAQLVFGVELSIGSSCITVMSCDKISFYT